MQQIFSAELKKTIKIVVIYRKNTATKGESKIDESEETDELDRLGENCSHFLIFEEGRAVGTLRLVYQDGETARLQRFCFYKEERGKGYGSAALRELESFCRKKAIRKITANAKWSSLGFYLKNGYIAEGLPFYEVGVKHVKILKEFKFS